MNAPVTVSEVDAATVQRWLDEDKAVLIDVREPMEYNREHIIGARLMPLSDLDAADFTRDAGKIAVCHCRTGNRSAKAAARIVASGFKEVYSLKGGIEAWKQAGLPVHLNRKAPIDITRQVQIAAGSLVVLGVVLALLISPWFMALSTFVGAGLVFAGVTGTCGMANLLALMPWNRTRTASPSVPHANTGGIVNSSHRYSSFGGFAEPTPGFFAAQSFDPATVFAVFGQATVFQTAAGPITPDTNREKLR